MFHSRPHALVSEWLTALPEWQAFWTVDEVQAWAQDLARRHPRRAEVTAAGHSRRGDPITVIRVGDGRLPALIFACPHPNEPIGALTVVALAERLATDEAFARQYDVRWYLLPCVDPDGTRLNEGWFRSPFTIERYARHFYRPPFPEQVEWTFPLDYRTLQFDAPLPETQALMRLIEIERPAFIYSLHNAGFGGAYFYISRELPGLADTLQDVVRAVDLPLSLGEPEVPYAPPFAQAVFGMPRKAAAYEYYASHAETDPATFLTGGAGSCEYAEAFGLRLGLVCEVPYFCDSRVADQTPTETPRRQSVLEGLGVSKTLYEFLAPRLEALRPYGIRSPFGSALEQTVQTLPARLAAESLAVERDPAYDRMASRAEVFDSQVSVRFYAVLSVGMFLRYVNEGQGVVPDEAWRNLRDEGEHLLEAWVEELNAATSYTVMPIRRLVAGQLTSGLLALEALLNEETRRGDVPEPRQ